MKFKFVQIIKQAVRDLGRTAFLANKNQSK